MCVFTFALRFPTSSSAHAIERQEEPLHKVPKPKKNKQAAHSVKSPHQVHAHQNGEEAECLVYPSMIGWAVAAALAGSKCQALKAELGTTLCTDHVVAARNPFYVEATSGTRLDAAALALLPLLVQGIAGLRAAL